MDSTDINSKQIENSAAFELGANLNNMTEPEFEARYRVTKAEVRVQLGALEAILVMQRTEGLQELYNWFSQVVAR